MGEHSHTNDFAFDTDCPACTRIDRARWRREYEAEKAKVKRIEHECQGAVEALERIAHHEREGDYAGQVNAMRAIAADYLNHPGGR